MYCIIVNRARKNGYNLCIPVVYSCPGIFCFVFSSVHRIKALQMKTESCKIQVMSIVETKNLKFEYIRRDDEGNVEGITTAIDDVSLEIKQGDFIAILGHNGSGKSTLAKHINAPSCIFHHSGADSVFLPQSGGTYLVSDGVAHHLYQCTRRDRGGRPAAAGDGGGVPDSGGAKNSVYLSPAGDTLFPVGLYGRSGPVLEVRHRRRGHRDPQRLHRRASAAGENLSGYAGPFRLDIGDCSGQSGL